MPTSKQTTTLRLPGVTPGTTREVIVRRWRGGDGPKAYIQASIHADEVPALLVAHHLERRLDELSKAGRLLGEIVLVPFANPIGLDQFLGGSHLGRFELDTGQNFNRGYPRVVDAVETKVAKKLGDDAQANVRTIRAALRAVLAGSGPQGENAALTWALFRLACDADIVLDLHCDYEALMHLYVGAPHWPAGRDLASALGAKVVLLADDSGGDAFDEACARVFWLLAERFPDHPIPPACFATTVELRGERDVDDDLADADAARLITFLAARGVIDAPARIARTNVLATRLEAVDVVNAPCSGVLVWRKPLGARVATGAVLGEIVVPGTTRREALVARTAGVVFARRGHRYVRAGQNVAKVAGKYELPWRKPGALLFD
jgi:predicted deacylase